MHETVSRSNRVQARERIKGAARIVTPFEAFLYVIGIGLAICAFLGLGILVLYLNAPDRSKSRAEQRTGGRKPTAGFRMGVG